MLELQRNLEYWPAQPLLANGQRIVFDGSELVWQEVPGQGIHLHPLANFGKLNAYARNRRQLNRTAQLLDELLAVAVPRGGGLAWEYYFTFDGGRGPWISGLSQGTGAAGRRALGGEARPAGGAAARRSPRASRCSRSAPPTGVRVRDRRGRALRPVLVLARRCASPTASRSRSSASTTSRRSPATRARRRSSRPATRRARVEIPTYDTGAWSLYSRGAITRESDLGYHTLLRDFLANLCDRTAAPEYCDTRDALHGPTSSSRR